MSDPPKRKRYLGPEEDNLNPQDGDDSTDRRLSIFSGDPQSSHHHAEQTPLQSIGCISQQFEEILAGSVSNCPKTTQSRIDPQTLRQTEVPLCSVYTTPSICDNQHQLLGSRSLPEDVVCPEEGAQLISHSQHVLQSTRQADTHLTNISCFRPQPEVSMDSKESLSSPMRTDSSDLAVYSDPILASSDPLVSSDPNVSVDINVSAEIDSCADINRSLEREEAHFPENCSILTRDTVTEQKLSSPALQPEADNIQVPPSLLSFDSNAKLEFESESEEESDYSEPELKSGSESESEEESLGYVQPEQELRDIISQMTIEDENTEYDPEEYVYECESSSSVETDGPLYEGATITFHESIVSILTFALSFRLTGVCIKALLDLIYLHIPKTANIFKKSLSAFKNYFAFIQGPKVFKYFCSKCYIELPAKTKCNNCKKSKVCYLIKLSVQQQLQALLQRSGFYQKLQFEHNQATGKYSDVYSGELYQNLLKKGSLGRDVLTFQWYTDGAALYSSSNMSVWPVYLTINELPYSERFKKENLLVPLIWCGSVKPRGNLLVDEMYDEMASLREGVKFNVAREGEKIIKGILINGTGDTPARSLMLNMVQFNGACSCQVCEQAGEPRPGCPGVRLFPFEEDQMIPRTLLKMEEYGEQGTEVKAVKGVKGPCSLSYVMPNYVLGTAIDWMHLVYGGVNKRELLLLLSSKKKAKAWSISKYQTVLNDRLQSIKPPAHIARVPRSLKDIKYWKTSEWKTWLNDYSLPVLEGVLPEIYLRHHGSLVAAAHLLNANEVSSESLTVAENLLKKYVSQFSDFYDPNHMTINIHLLLHLASVVANQGAAWVYTCFPLESLNGVILSLVHGTRWADRQIATSVQTCLALPEIVAKLPESEAKQFCSKVLNRRKYQGAEVVNGSAIIGKSVLLSQENVPPHFVNILEKANIKFQRLKQFHSLKRGHFLYVSLSSKASVCRDSSVAVYNTCNESNVGFIETFLRVYNCECINCSCDSKIIALVKKCEVVKKFKTLIPEVFVPNVAEYKLTEEYEVVCPTNLQGACVNMKINDKHYISKPTNTMEVE